ncbi:MAG TPA: ethanolamine ammonia-lyase reactivating factor EutA [Candidatus Limnocylindrales bacterium]|nr:ethanolamine ammonia-lyase reactivating factor EutA [Candidatus Limnocylindrales bacterium]
MSSRAAPVQEHLHDHDHDLEHEPLDEQRDAETAATIWQVDNVELTTVGIDVGSATSHLMFSHLHLRRRAQGYSSRFVVVERRVLYRSEILLTPYQADGLIDADRLETFFADAYLAAGLARDDIDAGAVILTGVALERANSRRIAELFADEGGKFVCASAGHNLEALLAAHGSGSVARSADGDVVLNIDVGGGTTKYALSVDGQVAATMAIWGGSRLIVVDDEGCIARVEPPVERIAADLGIGLEVGSPVTDETLERLATAVAARIMDAAAGSPPDEVLAGELPASPRPARIVFSGGVSEYLAEAKGKSHGDLGPHLARALRARIEELGIPVEPAAERIRATVIGASQFTLQLSGNTIHLSGPIELPMHNVPVVAIDVSEDVEIDPGAVASSIERRAGQLDLTEREEAIAIAVSWAGEPRYGQLRALADGIAAAHLGSRRSAGALIMVLEADIGASMGSILRDEIGVPGAVVAIDGIELSDLDFIDIGERIRPANVVPVVIKSLVFPHSTAERPRILGSA